jgi:hypothetical protein
LTAAVTSVCQPDHGVTIICSRFSFAVRFLALGIALDMTEHRMPDRRLAELARHRDMLSVIEVLAAEEYHLPFQEGVTHLLHLFRRQGFAEIDAADLRADMQRQRDDLDISVRAGALLC